MNFSCVCLFGMKFWKRWNFLALGWRWFKNQFASRKKKSEGAAAAHSQISSRHAPKNQTAAAAHSRYASSHSIRRRMKERSLSEVVFLSCCDSREFCSRSARCSLTHSLTWHIPSSWHAQSACMRTHAVAPISTAAAAAVSQSTKVNDKAHPPLTFFPPIRIHRDSLTNSLTHPIHSIHRQECKSKPHHHAWDGRLSMRCSTWEKKSSVWIWKRDGHEYTFDLVHQKRPTHSAESTLNSHVIHPSSVHRGHRLTNYAAALCRACKNISWLEQRRVINCIHIFKVRTYSMRLVCIVTRRPVFLPQLVAHCVSWLIFPRRAAQKSAIPWTPFNPHFQRLPKGRWEKASIIFLYGL